MSDAAQELAGRGLPVFPCKREDKTPYTKHGHLDASTNPNHIGNWWWRWPDALIGVPAKHFSVLDLDLQHDEARKWFKTNKDRLPPTRTHHTRSGGRHLLFRPGLRCTESVIHPHIDTKGEGKGYVIWWPAEGFPVEHPEMGQSSDTPLAAVPEWLVEAAKLPARTSLRTPTRVTSQLAAIVARARIKSLVSFAAAAQQGHRDKSTFWAACRLVELVAAGALDEDEARQLVIEAAVENGLGEEIGKQKFASAQNQFEDELP
jgi:hypothetical protein